MDQFFSLPAALTATPSPLVALIGLDSNDRHSHLWRAFSAQSIVSHVQTASQTQTGILFVPRILRLDEPTWFVRFKSMILYCNSNRKF